MSACKPACSQADSDQLNESASMPLASQQVMPCLKQTGPYPCIQAMARSPSHQPLQLMSRTGCMPPRFGSCCQVRCVRSHVGSSRLSAERDNVYDKPALLVVRRRLQETDSALLCQAPCQASEHDCPAHSTVHRILHHPSCRRWHHFCWWAVLSLRRHAGTQPQTAAALARCPALQQQAGCTGHRQLHKHSTRQSQVQAA
jgi:hypothetical protein